MKSCYHQRQLMQIIGLTIGGALSRLASQQEASQENWFNLLNRNKVLPKGGACLFTLHSLWSGASTINHNIDCPHCNFYIRVRSFSALSLYNCHSIYPVFFSFLFLRKLTVYLSSNICTYLVLIPVLNHSKSIYIHCLS